MITRSRLVDQLLKDKQQIRYSRNSSPLLFFSPKPFLTTWIDVIVAIFLAFLFGILGVLSYVSLCHRYFRLCLIMVCLAVFLPLRLKMSRKAFVKNKERRMLLPLSM